MGCKTPAALWVLLLCLSCAGEPASEPAAAAKETCYDLPAGTRFPRFGQNEDRLLLSYLKTEDQDSSRLRIRNYSAAGWSEAEEVISGEKWFINWADYPSVVPLGDENFYHYLAYSGERTYDYDVRYGLGDRPDSVLHQDGIAAEHGFLSSAVLADGSLQLTWLDGRNTKTADMPDHDSHDHHGGGPMSLRTATLAPDGSISGRLELDNRVCDCCNTASVSTDSLILVAYRDRSKTEIRDISFVTRNSYGEWSSPQPVHADNWEMSGCPVNGPALAANARGDIAIAWFTAQGDQPRVQFARYSAAEGSFSDPTLLDDNNPLGRLDLKLDEDGTAYVLGLASAEESDRAAVTLWTVDPSGAVTSDTLAEVMGARSNGFPRLALYENSLLYAITVMSEDEPFVRVCPIAR